MAPRATTERGARTRAAIMDAAIRLFARHGYRGAPLAAVASAVEMTQPGLLHHFPTKEHLLMAVLEQRDREDVRRMREAWHEGGEAALGALAGLVAHNATNPELVQMFTVLAGEAVSGDHPAHEFFADRYAHFRKRAQRTLDEGQDSGEFRSDVDTGALATLILAVIDGLQIQWLLDDEQQMPPAFAVFLDMLVRYLKPAPPAD
jgi:AcrR family transcriptional regulator